MGVQHCPGPPVHFEKGRIDVGLRKRAAARQTVYKPAAVQLACWKLTATILVVSSFARSPVLAAGGGPSFVVHVGFL